MPHKDDYQLHQRNQAIRRTFYRYIQTGIPRMLAYAQTAAEYYLSEKRVRDIIANR